MAQTLKGTSALIPSKARTGQRGGGQTSITSSLQLRINTVPEQEP